MPTSTNVTNLKINELKESQYDTAVQQGVIGENELSILTDVDEAIQVDIMPTASADELGKVYQFIGTTDANYTHGYFYECVSDGQTPATYSWSNIQVQASSGGLPSQTGNAGKLLTTDGTSASWSDTIGIPLYVEDSAASGLTNLLTIHAGTRTYTKFIIAQHSSTMVAHVGLASGAKLIFTQFGINPSSNDFLTFGSSNNKWSTIYTTSLYTTKINNGADINIPTTGGTMAVIGVNTTITLAVADWSSNTQTVNVTGMTATGVVMVSPDPTDQSAYTSAGILCTAQAAGTLTFTCDTVPSADIDVNVVML